MSVKTCATCRWAVNPGRFARCRAPRGATPRGSATGFDDLEREITFCTGQRGVGWFWARFGGNGPMCGLEGRFWEPEPIKEQP